MDIVTITNEERRGCGYRGEGGLYLVSGARLEPCGKLPLRLDVCPTCGQGIKPARAWTWVSSGALFENVKCLHNQLDPCCGSCILAEFNIPEQMGLLWIGEKFYKTPSDFMKEGIEKGFCRRIPAVPKDFVLGETWVLFAHRKTIRCDQCEGAGKYRGSDWNDLLDCPRCDASGYFPAIFSAFKPERIEYIVKADDDEEKLERLAKRGITLVKLERDLVEELFEVKEEVLA